MEADTDLSHLDNKNATPHPVGNIVSKYSYQLYCLSNTIRISDQTIVLWPRPRDKFSLRLIEQRFEEVRYILREFINSRKMLRTLEYIS